MSGNGRGSARTRRRLLAAAGLSLLGARASASPQVSPEAGARIRDILERARAQAGAQATPPEQRAALLAAGEQALAEGNADGASALFEQAGFIKHAADAELGLIRSYMQQGEYRRALAFAAHTAGAHPDVAAGSALYAWLLHLGGQSKIAGLMLDRARSRLGEDPLLAEVQALLASPQSRPAAALLAPPARFAPFSPSSIVLPASARTVGSGMLARSGRLALTAASMANADRLWVRNGLGRISAARLAQLDSRHGIAVLELAEPIVGPTLAPAGRDPFPGSPGYLVECAPGSAIEPAWPVMRIGFLGAASTAAGVYALGIEAPAGPRGGPVFGGAGQWVGLSVSRGGDGDAIVLASELHALVAGERPAARPDQIATHPAADEIYERALAVAVEVIAAA